MGKRMAKGYKLPPNFMKKWVLKMMKKKSNSGELE
jgi:hypothetical protein